MRSITKRTWKAQDLQAQRPRGWCGGCGREFYGSLPPGMLCRRCRRGQGGREAKGR